VKRLAAWIFRLLLGGAVIYGAILAYVWYVSRLDQRHRVDAILVLGAAHYNGKPSRVLRARLDHAVELYEARLATVIVVTGGMAEGDRVSEATVSSKYLSERGVPMDDIVVRPVGRNSQESIASAAEWLDDHDMHSVLLVSDPFHMARLVAESKANNLLAWVSPTRTSPISSRPLEEVGRFAGEALKVPVVWARDLFER
jgi:uncharacterized SAM-binding protein YcdF (DUF218 family)